MSTCPSKQLLVSERSLGSDPGFEVLTPFRQSNGSIFIVDRGWVSVGSKTSRPDYVPPAPTGLEHVTARLQQSETVLPGRVAPAGEISEINLPTVTRLVHLSDTYTGAYGLLSSETPKPVSRPIAASKPVLDPGPFLSYAFQWILFAVMGFGGLAWALRQEYRIRNAEDPVEREHAAERERKAPAAHPDGRRDRGCPDRGRAAPQGHGRRLTRARIPWAGRRMARPGRSARRSRGSRWSSTPSGRISTRSGLSASTAPSSWLTSTTAPV